MCMGSEIMPAEAKKYYCPEDDCIYFFDKKINRYRKICIVESPTHLPWSIRKQIKIDKEEAAETLSLPI